MYVKIIQLREMGMRRRHRDIDADIGVTGRLTVCIVENHPVMQLYRWGPPNMQSPDVLYPLYQPQIVAFSERGMIVRGLQRSSMHKEDAAPTCLQEWNVHFEREVPEACGAGQRP